MPSERAQVLILNGVYANDSDTFPNSRSYFNNWYATACTAPAQHGARAGFCRHAERTILQMYFSGTEASDRHDGPNSLPSRCRRNAEVCAS